MNVITQKFINSIGVDAGTTVMDFMQQEQERGITIRSAVASFPWRDRYRFNLIDTPGHADFTMEVEQSVSVLDGAVVLLDPIHGMQAQTWTVWRQADRYRIPRLVIVNKMDRDESNFLRAVASLHQAVRGSRSTGRVLPVQLPLFQIFTSDSLAWRLQSLPGQGKWAALADLVRGTITHGGDLASISFLEDTCPSPLDEATWRALQSCRAALVEAVCDHDDLLLDHVLNESADTASPDLLLQALRRVTVSGQVIPTLCGSAMTGLGVESLMDAIATLLPGPEDRPLPVLQVDGATASLAISDRQSSPLCALAFKVLHDARRGPIVFARIYSGTLKSKSVLWNVQSATRERIQHMLRLFADDYEAVSECSAGDIVALVGLKSTRTGHTLLDGDSKTSLPRMARLPAIPVPAPVFMCSVEPASTAHEPALGWALECLQMEDPSFQVHTHPDTGQRILHGMGELHLDILVDRLRRDFRIPCQPGPVWIAYRECLKQGRVLKGSYEEVAGTESVRMAIELDNLESETNSRLDNVIDCPVDAIQGLDVDEDLNLIQERSTAVVDSLRIGLTRGPLLGYPLSRVRVNVNQVQLTKAVPVPLVRSCAMKCISQVLLSSTQLSGIVEASRFVSNACSSLQEPLMKIHITFPAEYRAAVLSDFSKNRHGDIDEVGHKQPNDGEKDDYGDSYFKHLVQKTDLPGATKTQDVMMVEGQGDECSLTGLIPLSSTVGYMTALRSLTRGHCQMHMDFDSYRVMTEDRIVKVVKDQRGY